MIFVKLRNFFIQDIDVCQGTIQFFMQLKRIFNSLTTVLGIVKMEYEKLTK